MSKEAAVIRGGSGAVTTMTLQGKNTTSRWIWIAFAILVVVPLYGVAAVVFIRSSLFRLSEPLTADQIKAFWTFIGASFAAGATVLGALLTRSHNSRTLALQAESEARKSALETDANERLKLDTVVGGLNLISHEGSYSSKAVVAGGLATLVKLGHPTVAMRVLAAALEDTAVDDGTAAWLIGQVLASNSVAGTPEDRASGREEAAALLARHASALTDSGSPGSFEWPDALTAQWPAGLSANATSNAMDALIELLLSQSKEWWLSRGGTYSWIIYTLDECILMEKAPELRSIAAALTKLLLDDFDDEYVTGLHDLRSKSEILERLASVPGRDKVMDPVLWGRIRAWTHEVQRAPDPAPQHPIAVANP